MKTLELEFTSGAGSATEPLTYKQIQRSENVAIYQRNNSIKIVDYEVFEIKIQKKGTNVFNKITEEDTEKYPGSSQFGLSAWSCINLERAKIRFDSINKKVSEKIHENSLENLETKGEIKIPDVEFTTDDFAKFNQIYYHIAYVSIKKLLESNKVRLLREERRNAKGKLTKIYIKV